MWQLLGPDSAAQEAAPGPTSSAQVWVEATFIQVDTAELDGLKTASGKTLDPAQGRIILDGAEKAELLTGLRNLASSEVLGSASLVTLAGGQALMHMVEEVRYPAEYEAETPESETADGKTTKIGPPVVLPRTFEAREAGMRLSVMPTVSPDGKSITLVITPEVSFPAGWVNFGSQTFTQPVFSSWILRTMLVLPDGATLALIGVPTKNFEQSYLLSPQLAQKPKGTKSSVLLISAKIIKTGND